MTMYDDEKEEKITFKTPLEEKLTYKTLECKECQKFCGLYFRNNPTFFDALFFCCLACHQKHLDKKKKK